MKFIVCLILVASCAARFSNVIDMDDILSADFMPGSLLMLENPEESVKNFTNETSNVKYLNETTHDGSFNIAFSTMGFHRSKMNEYLCRNFIAEQIIEDMSITRMKRRLGGGPEARNKAMDNHKLSLRDNLIEDEGSSNYKNWLSKSTTLEDIYKHYQTIEKRDDDEEEKDEEHENEFDQQVTGYGYNQPQPVGGAKLGYSGAGGGYPSGGGYTYGGQMHGSSGGHGPVSFTYSSHGGGPSSHGGGPSSHGGYGYSGPGVSHHYDDIPPIHIHHEPPKYHGSHDSGGGKDLSEIFEIALTALAYLSFGMFVVHVVMCISQAKKQDTMYYMPVTVSSSTAGTVGMMGGGSGGTGMSMGAGGGMVMMDEDMMGEGGVVMMGDGGDMNGGGDMMGDGGDMMGGDGGDMMGDGGDMMGDGGDGGDMMNGAGDMMGDGGDMMGGDGGDMMGDGGDMTGDGGDMMNGDGGDMMNGDGGDMMGGDGDMMNGDGGDMMNGDDGDMMNGDGGDMMNGDGGDMMNGDGGDMMNGDGGDMMGGDGDMMNGDGGDMMNGDDGDMMNGDGGDMMNGDGVDMMNGDGGDMMNGDGDDMMNGDGGDMMNGDGGDMMNGDGGDMMNGDGDGMMDGDGGDMMNGDGDMTGGGDDMTGGDDMMAGDGGADGDGGEGRVDYYNTYAKNDKIGGTASRFALFNKKKPINQFYHDPAPMMGTQATMMGRRRRRKRANPDEIPIVTNPNNEALNELARHILTSIEAALVANQDDGSCLRKTLCENNRYSRSLKNSNKLWIPVWSLGMSWISGKLTAGIPRATSMLDSLKASILGLGKANCDVIYQECDLRKERQARRRRKRK